MPESLVAGIIMSSIVWFIYVIYLNDKIYTYKDTIRVLTSPKTPTETSKKLLNSSIYYTRLYKKSRVHSKELQDVIRELWRDARLKPLSVYSRDLNTIMEEYRTERKLLSRDWSEVTFPEVKIEAVAKEELLLANELANEG